MSLDPNQLYVISSDLADPQVITLRPKEAIFDGKEAILTVKTTSQPKWRLYKGANGTFTIALAGEDAKRIFVDDGKAWIEANQATEFSIESAGPSHGETAYRIHVPGQDAVLRASDKDSEQVTVAKEDGTPGEVWFFDVWHHA